MNGLAKRLARVFWLTPFYRIFLRPESALITLGWVNSVRKNAAVDADDAPIPWMTYPIIQFLHERLKKSFNVFEYGAGNSTLWLAKRVASIVSLEHDRRWFETIFNKPPVNVTLYLREVADTRTYGEMSFGDGSECNAYVDFIAGLAVQYDVIILDGIHRLSCLQKCVHCLAPTGVLVVDNSNDPVFKPARQRLQALGFREIPFYGMAPIHNWLSCSSVFYRVRNCFEI